MGVFKYFVPLYLQLVFAVGQFGAAVAWFFNPVQDEFACGMCVLNSAVHGFNFLLGLDIGMQTAAVKNPIMMSKSSLTKNYGIMIYTIPSEDGTSLQTILTNETEDLYPRRVKATDNCFE